MLEREPGDLELIARVIQRDEVAFRDLYDRYADLVFSVVMRVLSDEAASQDIAQEVFVRIWQNGEKFDASRGRFLPWLLSVARNRAVDEIRSRGRRRLHEHALLEGEDDPVDLTAADPALAAVLSSERQQIQAALRTLPVDQRVPIELAYFGGFTQQEIAAQLTTPLGTVKTRIRLGMQKLRLALGDATDGNGRA